ncbi:unnamed protein product, partial [Musa acuminata subsp. burmannicoides]
RPFALILPLRTPSPPDRRAVADNLRPHATLHLSIASQLELLVGSPSRFLTGFLRYLLSSYFRRSHSLHQGLRFFHFGRGDVRAVEGWRREWQRPPARRGGSEDRRCDRCRGRCGADGVAQWWSTRRKDPC